MVKVLVGGCFDILHYGHVQFLKKAKKLGSHLTVLLESDNSVTHLKGKGRPIHSQEKRRSILASLKFVDEVVNLPGIMHDNDYDSLIKKINPQVIVATEGDPLTLKKKKQAQALGARFVAIPKIKVPSTSKIAKLIGLEK